YIDGPAGLLSNLPGSPSPVYRSDDGGSTWTRLPDSLKADLPGGGDSDITVLPSGDLAETDLWLGSSTVSTSTDKGQTWTANPFQGVPASDRQWVASTTGAVYQIVHQIPGGLVLSESLDGGLVYPLHFLAASAADQTGCVCPPGNMVAESGGLLGDRLAGVYETTTNGVGFWSTTNGGLTFTNSTASPGITSQPVGFPVIADGGNGKLVVAWDTIVGGQQVTFVNTSGDFGATWGTPRQIVSTGTSAYPWVAYRNGKIAVSLYVNDAVATQDTTPGGTDWYVGYLESTDGGATFSALSVADPTPVKNQPICSGGTSCSANRELGDFQSVALDAAGHALISYVRSPGNDSSTTQVFVVKQG
ncbi:MAG TPA: hypothetical protein VNE21_00815, partial [Mycobacteriales bacterium]|nr:hypothetical protein [Mycobacteriales bacterium]